MYYLIFGAFAIICVDRIAAEEKRLLLTDPETLLSQIHALQLEVQQLKLWRQKTRSLDKI